MTEEGMKMETIATIRANDELDGEIIEIGYEGYTDDNENEGYRVTASNGDDIGYYEAQTAEKCISDICGMFGRWKTFNKEVKN